VKAKDKAEIIELICEAARELQPKEAKPQAAPEAKPLGVHPEECFIQYYDGETDTPEALAKAREYTLTERIGFLERTRAELLERLGGIDRELIVRRAQLARLPAEQAVLAEFEETKP
jgi:hypothetical protein